MTVWFDKFDVQPGESWRDALEAGLRSSDVIRDTPELTAEELSNTLQAA